MLAGQDTGKAFHAEAGRQAASGPDRTLRDAAWLGSRQRARRGLVEVGA